MNHNPNRPYIPDHPYRILIISGSVSDKTNMLLNLIKHIDKIYLYVKDPFESKYQLLTSGREEVGIKTTDNPKELTDYSQTIDNLSEM